MILPAICIIVSKDLDLVRRVKAYVRTMAEVRTVQDANRIDIVLQQSARRSCYRFARPRIARAVHELTKDWPDVLIIALGHSAIRTVSRSRTIRHLRDRRLRPGGSHSRLSSAGPSTTFACDRRPATCARNSDLVDFIRPLGETDRSPVPSRPPPPPLLVSPRVFRRSKNRRAPRNRCRRHRGRDRRRACRICSSQDREPDIPIRAGLRCLPETSDIEFSERDPLVRWFGLHARIVEPFTAAPF